MSNDFGLYSRVRIRSSRHTSEGAPQGSLGYIIESFDDGAYEVEISDLDGVTLAQIVVRPDEIEPDEPGGAANPHV
jgi:hypothetical protein